MRGHGDHCLRCLCSRAFPRHSALYSRWRNVSPYNEKGPPGGGPELSLRKNNRFLAHPAPSVTAQPRDQSYPRHSSWPRRRAAMNVGRTTRCRMGTHGNSRPGVLALPRHGSPAGAPRQSVEVCRDPLNREDPPPWRAPSPPTGDVVRLSFSLPTLFVSDPVYFNRVARL